MCVVHPPGSAKHRTAYTTLSPYGSCNDPPHRLRSALRPTTEQTCPHRTPCTGSKQAQPGNGHSCRRCTPAAVIAADVCPRHIWCNPLNHLALNSARQDRRCTRSHCSRSHCTAPQDRSHSDPAARRRSRCDDDPRRIFYCTPCTVLHQSGPETTPGRCKGGMRPDQWWPVRCLAGTKHTAWYHCLACGGLRGKQSTTTAPPSACVAPPGTLSVARRRLCSSCPQRMTHTRDCCPPAEP